MGVNKTSKKPSQEELVRMAWCKGFNAGFEKAKESISYCLREMGYAYEIPKAHELYELLEGMPKLKEMCRQIVEEGE